MTLRSGITMVDLSHCTVKTAQGTHLTASIHTNPNVVGAELTSHYGIVLCTTEYQGTTELLWESLVLVGPVSIASCKATETV